MQSSSTRFVPSEASQIQVQSPHPIRNVMLSRKNRLVQSSRLFDFIEDTEQLASQPETVAELSLLKFRSFHSEPSTHSEWNDAALEIADDANRMACKRHLSEDSSPHTVRPPSRARNPQVYDEEFLRMNRNGRMQENFDIFQRECLLSENIQLAEQA